MTIWWLELTDVDVCPESQVISFRKCYWILSLNLLAPQDEHDAKRWGLQDGGPLSIAHLPEPSVYGWTGKMVAEYLLNSLLSPMSDDWFAAFHRRILW